MSVEKAFEDAAYFAALVEYLKDDVTDAEVCDMLKAKPWLCGILFSVLKKSPTFFPFQANPESNIITTTPPSSLQV